MEPNMKKTMENAKALAGAVHDISHAVAHPMVTEVIKTQVQLAERIGQLEDDMDRTETSIDKVSAGTNEFMKYQQGVNASLSQEINSAVGNISTPEDDRVVKMEKQIHRLESQMSELIRLFGEAAQLD
jgi:uncharacterized protein YdcH (DUF465 family)